MDFALARDLPHGGWVPKGRLAEDGPLDPRYALRETATSHYAERTRKNVLSADATLILYCGRLTGGSLLTAKLAKRMGKPLKTVDLNSPRKSAQAVRNWLRRAKASVLNVAGPRASTTPGIYEGVRAFLEEVFPEP